MLVPRGLRKSGLSADSSLAGYGVIQGMAMPLIGFPSCLLMAVAEKDAPALLAALKDRVPCAAQVGYVEEKREDCSILVRA